jgi:hypothetical protein
LLGLVGHHPGQGVVREADTPPETGALRARVTSAKDGIGLGERPVEATFVLGPVSVEGTHKGSSRGHGPGLASLACKGDSPSNSVEASPGEVDDLRQEHPGQAEAQADLVAKAVDGAVLTGADQKVVGLLAREPAPGVLGLHLAVRLGVLASQWRQLGAEVGRQPGPGTPGQEGPHARQALADGVVGQCPAGAGDPGEQVGLGQLRGVPAAGRAEQIPEMTGVLLPGLGVGVAGQELEEDLGQLGVGATEWDDRRNTGRPGVTR